MVVKCVRHNTHALLRLDVGCRRIRIGKKVLLVQGGEKGLVQVALRGDVVGRAIPGFHVHAALQRNIEAYLCGADILAALAALEAWMACGELQRSLTHGNTPRHLELNSTTYVKQGKKKKEPCGA